MSLTNELEKLSRLHASGQLTDQEFATAKSKILLEVGPNQVDGLLNRLNSYRRNRSDRWIGGVCGGLFEATGLQSWIWRLVFVFFLLTGAGLFIYLLLWLFVPAD